MAFGVPMGPGSPEAPGPQGPGSPRPRVPRGPGPWPMGPLAHGSPEARVHGPMGPQRPTLGSHGLPPGIPWGVPGLPWGVPMGSHGFPGPPGGGGKHFVLFAAAFLEYGNTPAAAKNKKCFRVTQSPTQNHTYLNIKKHIKNTHIIKHTYK